MSFITNLLMLPYHLSVAVVNYIRFGTEAIDHFINLIKVTYVPVSNTELNATANFVKLCQERGITPDVIAEVKRKRQASIDGVNPISTLEYNAERKRISDASDARMRKLLNR